jgi:hypothetical protein
MLLLKIKRSEIFNLLYVWNLYFLIDEFLIFEDCEIFKFLKY